MSVLLNLDSRGSFRVNIASGGGCRSSKRLMEAFARSTNFSVSAGQSHSLRGLEIHKMSRKREGNRKKACFAFAPLMTAEHSLPEP